MFLEKGFDVLVAEFGAALERVRGLLGGGDNRQARPVEVEHVAVAADQGRANG